VVGVTGSPSNIWRPFELPTGEPETPTESLGAFVDHVSAWNVDDLQADHKSELKRLETTWISFWSLGLPELWLETR
jgi:hypothetical protein